MEIHDLVAQWPDLHPFRCAELLEGFSHFQNKELAEMIGVSESLISRLSRAYRRSTPEVRSAWQEGRISTRAAYAIASLQSPEQNDELKRRLNGHGQAVRTGQYNRPSIKAVRRKLRELLNHDADDDRYRSGAIDALSYVVGDLEDFVIPLSSE